MWIGKEENNIRLGMLGVVGNLVSIIESLDTSLDDLVISLSVR